MATTKLKKQALNISSWTDATLLGSWVNFGGGFFNVGYMIDAEGFVHLRGLCKSGTGNIFTLPSGNRPASIASFTVSGNDAFARVEINSSGVVYISTGSGTTFLTLDGITFEAV